MTNKELRTTYSEIGSQAQKEVSEEFFPGNQATTDDIIAAYNPPGGVLGTLKARMYASELTTSRLNAEEIGDGRRPVTIPRVVKIASDFTFIGDQLVQYATIITGRDLDSRRIDSYERATRLLGIGVDVLSGFIPFLESSHINSWVIDWLGDRFKNTTPSPLKEQLKAVVEKNFQGHVAAREAAFKRGMTSVYGKEKFTAGVGTFRGLGVGIDEVRKFLTVDRTIAHLDKATKMASASPSLSVRKYGLTLERESHVDHFVRGKEGSIPEAYPSVDALRNSVVTLGLFALALSALTTADATGMVFNQLGEIGARISEGSVIVQSGYAIDSIWNGLGRYIGGIGGSTNVFLGELGNLFNNLKTMAIAGGVTLGAHMLGDPYQRIKQTSTVVGPALGKIINRLGGVLEFFHL